MKTLKEQLDAQVAEIKGVETMVETKANEVEHTTNTGFGEEFATRRHPARKI